VKEKARTSGHGSVNPKKQIGARGRKTKGLVLRTISALWCIINENYGVTVESGVPFQWNSIATRTSRTIEKQGV